MLTLAVAIGSATAVSLAPRPAVVLLFFAFVFGPAVVWNACFHLGATLWSRTYCPGTVTGALLYLPLGVALAGAAVRDGLATPGWLGAALGVALVAHAAEVGHTVFKRW